MLALTRLFPVYAGKQSSSQVPDATLVAWLDSLIPADETPSATQLGVDRMMLARERKDPDYRIVLEHILAGAMNGAGALCLCLVLAGVLSNPLSGFRRRRVVFFVLSTRGECV